MKLALKDIRHDNIKQLKKACKDDIAKREFLQAFYENSKCQAIIFVNKKKTAEFLVKLFE